MEGFEKNHNKSSNSNQTSSEMDRIALYGSGRRKTEEIDQVRKLCGRHRPMLIIT